MEKSLLSKLIAGLFLLVFVGKMEAQVVTIDPSFPTIDEQITLTFDVKEASDSRAEGLLGLTDDVFLWSGAGTVDDAFQFGPPGQTNFNVPFEPGRMTFEGNDIWSITFVPRDYFDIPQGTEITRLGLLLKNGNGSSQTEDLFVEMNPGSFITFESPQDDNQYVELNDVINFSARASEAGNLEILIDEGSGFQSVATATNATSISHDYTVTNGPKTISVKAVAVLPGGTEENVRDINIILIRDSDTQTKPAGIVKGINYDADDTKVTLCLFAPNKRWIYAVGDFNNWAVEETYLMKRDGDFFWIELTGLTPGQPYVFGYLINDDDISSNAVLVGDPYADVVIDPNNDQFIPSEVYPDIPPSDLALLPSNRVQGGNVLLTAFETAQTPYDWGPGEDTWIRPEESDLVIYELLVRDFTGSYKTMIDTLDYLQRLGVNAIELMPIMEFGGNDNWGYQPDFYMAPDKSYGTKDDLKAFVEACHEKGMAVILDVVFNHADKHPYVFMYFDFDTFSPRADNPMFNESAIPSCVDFFRDWNHENSFTVDLIDSTLIYWIEEFHVDGYRFDVSHGFTQNTNCGGFDQDRIDNVLHYANTIWAADPDAYVTLEHFAFDEVNFLGSQDTYTWAFNAKFNYQNIMKADPPTSDITEAAIPSVVASMENHDEQRLVYEAIVAGRSEDSYDIQSIDVALERAKMATAFFFPLPGPKLMWMFGELGYDIDINFNGRTGRKPSPWGTGGLGYYEDPDRQKLFGVYSAVINLTHDYQEVFDEGDMDLDRLNDEVKRIAITHPTMDVVILGNWTTGQRTIDPDFTQATTWYDYFSGDAIEVANVNEPTLLYPGEFHIYTTLELPTPEGDLVNSPDPPEVEPIADQVMDENTTSDPISITIIPGREPIENVTLEAGSSSPIITNDGFVFTGTGTERTLTITPRANQSGTTEISVTASDGIYSSTTTFMLEVVDVVTGLEDDILASRITVYPNPNQGVIQVRAGKDFNGKLDLQLYDLAGKKISRRETYLAEGQRIELDITGYESGLYFLEITDEEQNSFVRKIVKE